MNRHLIKQITTEEKAAYDRDGVVCIRGQFDEEWIIRMRNACTNDMAESKGRVREVYDEEGPGHFYGKVFMGRDDHNFRTYNFESPAAQIAAEIMDLDNVRFFYDQLFIKTPGTKAPTPWHHDLPYWPFRGNHIASVWLALTPVDQETSGVVYIAGSHKWGKFYRAVTPDQDTKFSADSLEECPEFHKEFHNPEYKFLSWDMKPGDVLVHHPLTVHGSGRNQSATQTRIGLSCRYIGGDAVWDPRDHVMVIDDTEHLQAGVLPTDDKIFPVAWQKTA